MSSAKQRYLMGLLAATLFVCAPLLLWAFSNNPPTRLTGAPGEGNCSSCHGGGLGGGHVSITFSGGGTTYTPGITQMLTVTVTDPNSTTKAYGFEFTALEGSVATTPGTFAPASANVDAPRTSLTKIYEANSSTGSNTFLVNWTPPASSVYSGPVVFYVASVAGDGTDTSTDSLYQTSATLAAAVAPTLSASPGSLTFNYTQGGAVPAAQSISLTSSGAALSYTVAPSTTSGGSWLSATPASGTTPGSESVSVSPSGIAQGTYQGTVTVTGSGASNSPVSVPVTLNVAAPPNLTVTPNTLTFNYQIGGTPPPAQTVSVGSTGAALSYTVTTSGGTWLSATPMSSTTPGTESVSVNTAGLTAGTYTGTVSIASTAAGNSPQTVAVTVNVTTTTSLTVAPSSLTFNYQIGGTAPGSQPVSVVSTGVALSYTVTTSGGTWLSATPMSSTTPGTESVSVSTAGLAQGTYTGSVSIASTGAGNSPQTVAVTLNVAAALVVGLLPSSLTFPGQLVGTTSSPQPVTLSNLGSAALAISGIATSGDFAQTNTCGTSVGVGATCTIQVAFNPTAAGTRTGNLTVTDNASNSPQKVSLSGTGRVNPVPQISQSLVPTSAAPGGPGFTLKVSGVGFASGAIVNWNGSTRPTNFVGSTQLTATISASDLGNPGTAAITVTNPSPGGGTSNVAFFSITTPIPAIALSGSSFPTGMLPRFAVVGDFSGGSKRDLAIVSEKDNAVSILLGKGDGTFSTPIEYPTGASPVSAVAGDFNGDGKLDLAVVNQTVNTVSILLGNGDGTFAPAVNYPTGVAPISIAAADFKGDGKLDLVVVNQTDHTVSILLGNGDGTFASHVDYPTGAAPVSVAIADLNGDGKPDLAVVNQNDNTISFLAGNGDGTFAPHVDYTTGAAPVSVAIADFNGDSKPDLVVVNQTDNTVSILLGKGDGTFASHVDYPTGIAPVSLTVGDFHGGGKLDLAVVNQKDNTLSILAGNGDGTFASHVDYGTGSAPSSVAVADFNGDGRLDLAVTNQNDNTVTVLLTSSVADVQPSSLIFGSEIVGVISPAQTISVKNKGSTTLTITSIQSTGEFPQTNDCQIGIAPQSGCTISVRFNPTAAGARTGTLTIAGPLMGTAAVSLSGTGGSPLLTLSPATLTFDILVVGTTSVAKTVTLSNTGSLPLTVSSIAVSADFAQTNNCGSSVAAASNCTISVTFTPSAGGDRTGTLTVTDNATGSPQTVALKGGGFDFSLTVASGSSPTAMVSAGQTATYSLSLAPTNGFNSLVNFTCTGAPAHANCTVTPNPATLSGTSATTITVSVTTTATSGTAPKGRFTPPAPSRSRPPWPVSTMALLLAVLGWLTWTRRPTSAFHGARHWRSVPAILALVTMLSTLGLAVWGCGGGVTGSSNPRGTPSRTYTLTVTGTPTWGPTSLHHDLGLSLTVN